MTRRPILIGLNDEAIVHVDNRAARQTTIKRRFDLKSRRSFSRHARNGRRKNVIFPARLLSKRQKKAGSNKKKASSSCTARRLAGLPFFSSSLLDFFFFSWPFLDQLEITVGKKKSTTLILQDPSLDVGEERGEREREKEEVVSGRYALCTCLLPFFFIVQDARKQQKKSYTMDIHRSSAGIE